MGIHQLYWIQSHALFILKSPRKPVWFSSINNTYLWPYKWGDEYEWAVGLVEILCSNHCGDISFGRPLACWNQPFLTGTEKNKDSYVWLVDMNDALSTCVNLFTMFYQGFTWTLSIGPTIMMFDTIPRVVFPPYPKSAETLPVFLLPSAYGSGRETVPKPLMSSSKCGVYPGVKIYII